MPQRVLNEDWSDYDNRKIRDSRDARFFACTETWELDYLVNKIRKVYPQYSEYIIRITITTCCRTVGSPHPRWEFVECVIRRLRV